MRQLDFAKQGRESITDGEALNELQEIFDKTWVPAHGRRLDRTRLKVTSITKLSNDNLFQKYLVCLDNFKDRAASMPDKRFLKVDNIKGRIGGIEVGTCRPIRKIAFKSTPMKDFPCNRDVNELYLFHGTRAEGVDAICATGLPLNFGQPALCGKAVHLDESAHRADQYAGNIQERVSKRPSVLLDILNPIKIYKKRFNTSA